MHLEPVSPREIAIEDGLGYPDELIGGHPRGFRDVQRAPVRGQATGTEGASSGASTSIAAPCRSLKKGQRTRCHYVVSGTR